MRRVVITGIGIISPVGNDRQSFAKNLEAGRHGIDFITGFDASAHKAKLAAEVKDFNPLDHMPKPEARRTDRFAQFAVAAAAQAVEDSGGLFAPPERTGAYVGAGIGGIATFEAEAGKCIKSGPSAVSPYFIAMMIPNMASGAISIKYGITGPTLPVVTACATSSHAIGEAFRTIKHGYADVILAGGSEAAITPLSVAGFTNNTALSLSEDKDSASIPFDARRNGFVMGEGAAVMVLEEYEQAKKRGAKIYAEISGYANTADASHITAPREDGRSAANAMAGALKEAGISTGSASKIYVNAHGTSTPLNDKIETLALKSVFGADAYSLAISSTKSMTGHCLGAAGAIEAAACALTLSSGIIFPTAGYLQADADCDLDYTVRGAVRKEVTAALSNSFGFGGHNACLCLTKV